MANPTQTDSKEPTDTSSPEEVEGKPVVGPHTQRLANSETSSEASLEDKRQESKDLAMYMLDVMLKHGTFKDMNAVNMQGMLEQGRSLFITRDQLQYLPFEYSDDDIEEATLLLCSAIRHLAPSQYVDFTATRTFGITYSGTDKAHTNEYHLVFPIEMLDALLVKQKPVSDKERKTSMEFDEQEEFYDARREDPLNELILDKLDEWSDPEHNPDNDLEAMMDDNSTEVFPSQLENAMDYALDFPQIMGKPIQNTNPYRH